MAHATLSSNSGLLLRGEFTRLLTGYASICSPGNLTRAARARSVFPSSQAAHSSGSSMAGMRPLAWISATIGFAGTVMMVHDSKTVPSGAVDSARLENDVKQSESYAKDATAHAEALIAIIEAMQSQ